LQTEPGGDFILPGAAVAVAQEQVWQFAVSLQAKNLWIFYLNLGWCWTAQDGSQAAMVKFNSDYTRALFW